MGIIGTAAIVDRMVELFQQEFNDEVDNVDTYANALYSAGADGNFETPEIAADDMQPFGDFRQHEKYRIIFFEEGRVQAGEQFFQMEGVGGGRPRIDLVHQLKILFVATAASKTLAGKWQAYRIADRYATAGRVLLMRFPKLSIPAPGTKAYLPGTQEIEFVRDVRGAGTDEKSRFMVVRELGLNVRRIEVRET